MLLAVCIGMCGTLSSLKLMRKGIKSEEYLAMDVNAKIM